MMDLLVCSYPDRCQIGLAACRVVEHFGTTVLHPVQGSLLLASGQATMLPYICPLCRPSWSDQDIAATIVMPVGAR